MNNNQRLAASGLAACLLAGLVQPASANVVTEWNQIAMGCITRTGPATALDVALVQLAMHDAVQAIEKRYETYRGVPYATGDESKAAAAAAAAYTVLSDNRICPVGAAPVPPSQFDSVQLVLENAFNPYRAGGDPGVGIGEQVGTALLAEYRAGSPTSPTHFGGSAIGQWRPTPSTQTMTFVFLTTTTPFVMTSQSQFRPGPPPAITSQQYLKDYNEVKALGSTTAHPEGTECPAPASTDMARFWAGNFGVQWNQTLRDVAIDRQLGIGDTARLLALANVAAADAGIGIWDSKKFYDFWRPNTAIVEGDADGNPRTVGQADWRPFIETLGAVTPPYPDYLSGANGLTGAYTAMLQLFFKTDNVPLAIHKASPATVAICTTPRLYRRISDAAEEVVDARVLLGIHFRFADTGARTLGNRVAWHVFTNILRPKHPGWDGNGKN